MAKSKKRKREQVKDSAVGEENEVANEEKRERKRKKSTVAEEGTEKARRYILFIGAFLYVLLRLTS